MNSQWMVVSDAYLSSNIFICYSQSFSTYSPIANELRNYIHTIKSTAKKS